MLLMMMIKMFHWITFIQTLYFQRCILDVNKTDIITCFSKTVCHFLLACPRIHMSKISDKTNDFLKNYSHFYSGPHFIWTQRTSVCKIMDKTIDQKSKQCTKICVMLLSRINKIMMTINQTFNLDSYFCTFSGDIRKGI